jgi:hypothetical protein
MSQLNYAHKIARWFENNPSIDLESYSRIVGCFQSLHKDLSKPKNLCRLKQMYGDKAYTCINKFSVIFGTDSFGKGMTELGLSVKQITETTVLLDSVLNQIQCLKDTHYDPTSIRKDRQCNR